MLFVRLDRNGDGVLSVKEFVEGMQVVLPGLSARAGVKPPALAPAKPKSHKHVRAELKKDGQKKAKKGDLKKAKEKKAKKKHKKAGKAAAE